MFKRKSTKKQEKLPVEVKISKEEIPLAQSDFNLSKITEIQGRFQGGCTLLIPGRIFIREGTLLKVCRRGPKPRHFFLFNDVLVYGTVLSRGHYAQQHVLTLDQMSVSAECHFMPQVYSVNDDGQIDEHLDVDNAFQINHTDKSFHVFAPNLSDKSNWLTNLKKFITKAQTGQENIQLVTRAVWVPDGKVTECMVCRKSKFTTFNRKHHCRNCGKVVCATCSSHRVDLLAFQGKSPKPSEERLERVCSECHATLAKKFTRDETAIPKSITILDAKPLSPTTATKKPDRPPQPDVNAVKESVQDKAADSAGDDTSDSDDSEKLDEEDKEELQETRRMSLLSGTSWEVAEKGEGSKEESQVEIPQAPPRRKKRDRAGQEADLKVCVKCDKKLKIGEFGFLNNECYCKEHFKERYVAMQEEAEEEEEEKPVPKPRPRKSKSDASVEENEKTVPVAEETQEQEEERKPTGARIRKPNRFKKKAEESSKEETVAEPESEDNSRSLLAENSEAPAEAEAVANGEEQPKEAEKSVPESEAALPAEGSCESPKTGVKGRRKKTKFKSKIKDTD